MSTKNHSKIKNVTDTHTTTRPPVVAVLGHVDHGKSTLLDYIRKTNIVDGEAGGITQKVSAYEVERVIGGTPRRITFLDTPGHEAFSAIRSRGAQVADVAILVVSAEDGVRPQTIEARDAIRKAHIPFVVAINKIDKEGADIERTKASLAENDIYVEGYGGDVSWVAISAKTGKGVSELLDLVDLAADIAGLSGDPLKPAEGVVIESSVDHKKGIATTLVIKDGTIRSGMTIVAGTALAPVRLMENTVGTSVREASFSSPIRLFGWNELPPVGAPFKTFTSKKEAETITNQEKENIAARKKTKNSTTDIITNNDTEFVTVTFPIILKAANIGGLEALKHEVAKIHYERLIIKTIAANIGDVNENDIKTALADKKTIIVGFNVHITTAAKGLAQTSGVTIELFDIIYKLSEWLANTAAARVPKVKTEEPTGIAKVLKFFSKTRDRQIIGGRAESGLIKLGGEVKIMRRDFEVGRGRIRELQRQKNKATEISEGQEFGALVESKIEIAPGDRLEAFIVVEK